MSSLALEWLTLVPLQGKRPNNELAVDVGTDPRCRRQPTATDTMKGMGDRFFGTNGKGTCQGAVTRAISGTRYNVVYMPRPK